MKEAMFSVFALVYVATAVATLVAFLAQARIIPSGLPDGETIPHLRLLISAVLVESVGGYLALAKNLFGLQSSDSGAEQEIKSLAWTSMKILS